MAKLFFALASVAFILGIQGCKKTINIPPCVAGTLLGTTCEGSYLIQVDTTAQQNIGTPIDFRGDAGTALAGPPAQFRVYNNVISTFESLPTMQRGTKFYFQYKAFTNEPGVVIPITCPQNAIQYYAPRFELLATSVTSCVSLLPE